MELKSLWNIRNQKILFCSNLFIDVCVADRLTDDAVMSSYNTDINEELVHFKGKYMVVYKAIQTCLF
jgi:hypothetical protein